MPGPTASPVISELTLTDVVATLQPLDDNLTAIAGLTSEAGKVVTFSGPGAAAVVSYSATASSDAIPQADSSAHLDTWISTQSDTVAGLQKRQPHLVIITQGGGPWTDMPAAHTEMVISTVTRRLQMDLTNFIQARLSMSVTTVGFSGSKIGIQYSTDAGSTWKYLDDTADGAVGSATPQGVLTSTGVVTSAWMNLATAAKADVLLRAKGSDGNGATDPVFSVVLQVR